MKEYYEKIGVLMMHYPYATLCNNIEITHTPLINGKVTVHIEIPDYDFCFRSADCIVPDLEVINIYKMTEEELKFFRDFCKANSELIVLCAEKSGMKNVIDFSCYKKDIKLTTDYELLCDYYRCEDLFAFKQNCKNQISLNLAEDKTRDKNYTIPGKRIVCPIVKISGNLKDPNVGIVIHNNLQEEYHLPKFVENNFNLLFSAHEDTSLVNNKMLRLEQIDIVDNTYHLYFGITDYFKTMVTNRVMDFPITENLSLRRMYTHNGLADTILSNHLGFNAVIKTEDDYIVFVHRHNSVSIESNSLGLGVQGSIKWKYIKDYIEDDFNTMKGIYNSMQNEVCDELGVNVDDVTIKDILICYRNLVEGGKPQFFTVIDINLTSKQLAELFMNYVSSEKDGTCLDFLKYSDMVGDDVCITPDVISGNFYNPVTEVHTYKAYRTVPSTSVCLLFYKQFLCGVI